MMRICIFGAGSLGSALGGILAGKNEVTLVGRKPHVSVVARDGLTLTGDVRRKVRLCASETIEGVDVPDLLILTTKAYDTQEAVSACRRIFERGTMVLTLQNGIGNLELLREWKGPKAFGGTTTLGATLIAPGRVRISGLGTTIIGSDVDSAGAANLSSMFRASGLPSRTEREIAAVMWSKLVVSASINPLTAVLRVRNGQLLTNPAVSRLMCNVCSEAVEVANKKEIPLDRKVLCDLVRVVAKDTENNRSSMLQDIEHGKRTEIDQINGAIWRIAEKMGTQTPLNKALWAMVSSMEGRCAAQKG